MITPPTTGTPLFPHIGSHVHEIGHLFGLRHPHDGAPSTPDVYFWSPIQSDDKNGGDIGSSPIALTPEEMKDLGFASFTTLSGRRDGLTISAGNYYQIDYSPGHFVIEHRNGGGNFNNYLWKDAWSGSGLLLWFTDVNATGPDTQNQCLVAADGNPRHDQNMFGDLFPGTGNVTAINDDTSPEPNDATGISRRPPLTLPWPTSTTTAQPQRSISSTTTTPTPRLSSTSRWRRPGSRAST